MDSILLRCDFESQFQPSNVVNLRIALSLGCLAVCSQRIYGILIMVIMSCYIAESVDRHHQTLEYGGRNVLIVTLNRSKRNLRPISSGRYPMK